MPHPPLHKGAYGVNYRTQIGLHMLGPSRDSLLAAGDPAWDVFVGPLPFLVAPDESRPYVRESAPYRRDRFDSARDPGENSLDSGLWIRSQTSWHLGAGQRYAEPLETDPDVARFRFHESGGVDPWTPGRISLLPDVENLWTGGTVATCLGIDSDTVIAAGAASLRKVNSDGSYIELAALALNRITVSKDYWYGVRTNRLEWGLLAGGGQSGLALTGAGALNVALDRLWVGAGGDLYEVPITGTPALGQPYHSFSDGNIVDIDSGAGGVYVMVQGATSRIYVVTAQDDGTLLPPREVATLPRGEDGRLLYGYLGSYLAVSTTRGIRIADCSTQGSLPIGPLVIEQEGGAYDAVGLANFLYVTAGTEGIQPDPESGDTVPGLYRIDLSAPLRSGDGVATLYAYATDLAAPTTGVCTAVTAAGTGVWFTAGGVLWRQDDTTRVTKGWVSSGEVSYSTAERKAWSSMTLEVTGAGSVVVDASQAGGNFDAVTQTAVAVPVTTEVDVDTRVHVASGWLEHRVTLNGDGTPDGSPMLQSVGLRAMPSPRRTRYIRLPLLCLDHQADRHNSPVGYDGFAWDRIADLEAMEVRGELITLTDLRTGETVRTQIEQVQFNGYHAPSKIDSNAGGIINLTLLVV